MKQELWQDCPRLPRLHEVAALFSDLWIVFFTPLYFIVLKKDMHFTTHDHI